MDVQTHMDGQRNPALPRHVFVYAGAQKSACFLGAIWEI